MKSNAFNRIRNEVRGVRDKNDAVARHYKEDLEEAREAESEIESVHKQIDSAARDVEVCDMIHQKLDELARDHDIEEGND